MKKIIVLLTLFSLLLIGCNNEEPTDVPIEPSLEGYWATKASEAHYSGVDSFFKGTSYYKCYFTKTTCRYGWNGYYTKYRLVDEKEWSDTSLSLTYEKMMSYVVTDKVITFVDMYNSPAAVSHTRIGLIHALTEDYLELFVEMAPNNYGFAGKFDFYKVYNWNSSAYL